MKLVIQIPCYNEEEILPEAIGDLPEKIEGIDEIEILVIDDGSKDNTSKIARELGAKVVRHNINRGLATAFMTGLKTALSMGADIIVNTDADNQYKAEFIPNLIAPIAGHQADMVIGARPISTIDHFSPVKKVLQKIGSGVVRLASGTTVPDAPSGFRAYSREAAKKINVFSNFTYTLETIIQCGIKNIVIKSIPVDVNPPTRDSRLFKSTFSYVLKSFITISRIFLIYRSFRFLATVGSILFTTGLFFGIRFLFYYFFGDGTGHTQSLILAAILMIIGFQTGLIGIVTDLLAANRKLLEDIQFHQRHNSLDREEDESSSSRL